MRKIFTKFLAITVLTVGPIALQAQGTMRIQGAGLQIVASGAPSIVLNNMHYVNNVSNAMFTAANSNFYFVGNATTDIFSTAGFGPFGTTFYNTIFNKTGGSELRVTSNGITLTTSNQLTMTSGNVNMMSNLTSTWQLGTSTANLGTLSRVTGHFYAGFFQRWYSVAIPGLDVAQWDIPVGMNAASYNYARVYYPVAPTAGGNLRTMFVPTNPFYNGMPMFDATNPGACTGSLGAGVDINNCANEGYWLISKQFLDPTDVNYTIKLNYTNFTAPTSENCLRIIKSENLASWMQEGVHGLTSPALDWVTRDQQTGFPGAGNTTAMFTIAGDVLLNPLPVELAAFNANCTSNSIMINWSTASENGNDYFVLERTKDLMTWDIVATIPTLNGYSNAPQQYSFEDHSVYDGTFYYRLNQVDVNGTPKTYPPITVSCNGTNADPALLNAYQTAEGQVNVVLFAPSDMDYVLSFYDLHGQKISVATGMLAPGNTTVTINANTLRDAYYLIHVQIGDKNLSRKIFVK